MQYEVCKKENCSFIHHEFCNCCNNCSFWDEELLRCRNYNSKWTYLAPPFLFLGCYEFDEKDKTGPYTVYKHTSPDGRVYIGVTRQNPPEKRYKNKNSYKSNRNFHIAIEVIGWENFKHEIIVTGVSKTEAHKKERELINENKSTNPMFGFNKTDGGFYANTLKYTERGNKK